MAPAISRHPHMAPAPPNTSSKKTAMISISTWTLPPNSLAPHRQTQRMKAPQQIARQVSLSVPTRTPAHSEDPQTAPAPPNTSNKKSGHEIQDPLGHLPA